MIRFRYDPNETITPTKLVYVPSDYAFNAEPRPKDCALAVSINELQLMIDEDDQRVVFAEGYCPHLGWKSRRLAVPQPLRAALFVDSDAELIPGVSRRVSGDERWPALVDANSGWVCIGNESAADSSVAVEFAPGAVAVLDDERLVALWLRPERLPPNLPAALEVPW